MVSNMVVVVVAVGVGVGMVVAWAGVDVVVVEHLLHPLPPVEPPPWSVVGSLVAGRRWVCLPLALPPSYY